MATLEEMAMQYAMLSLELYEDKISDVSDENFNQLYPLMAKMIRISGLPDAHKQVHQARQTLKLIG